VRLPPTIKEPGSGADVGTRPRLPPLSFERSDVLAANQLGRALYADLYADPTRPPNFARFTFLDAAARRFFPDWDLAADMSVANRADPLHALGVEPVDRLVEDERPGVA
jgi:MmyB-like transcription regulator ligand binding domain